MNKLETILKRLEELQPQVEKLVQENNDLEERVIHQDNKIKRLESVIDKAIEYIENNKMYGFKYDEEEIFEIITDDKCKKDLLEILRNKDDKNL